MINVVARFTSLSSVMGAHRNPDGLALSSFVLHLKLSKAPKSLNNIQRDFIRPIRSFLASPAEPQQTFSEPATETTWMGTVPEDFR